MINISEVKDLLSSEQIFKNITHEKMLAIDILSFSIYNQTSENFIEETISRLKNVFLSKGIITQKDLELNHFFIYTFVENNKINFIMRIMNKLINTKEKFDNIYKFLCEYTILNQKLSEKLIVSQIINDIVFFVKKDKFFNKKKFLDTFIFSLASNQIISTDELINKEIVIDSIDSLSSEEEQAYIIYFPFSI